MQTLCRQAEILSYCQREYGKDKSKEEQEACSPSISVGYRSRRLHVLSELLGRGLRLQEFTPMISISKGFQNKYQNRHFPL